MGVLEDVSLWYRYKTDVWSEQTPMAAAIHNSMRLVRSLHNFQPVAYASTPVSSGRWMYERALSGVPLDFAREEAFAEHYTRGLAFIQELVQRVDRPVFFPAELAPARQTWEQKHFMALWLSIIAESTSEVHMNDDWQYSNGCAEEFTHAWQLKLGVPRNGSLAFFNTKLAEDEARAQMAGITVYDRAGKPLTIEDGLGLLDGSIAWLRERRFDTSRVVEARTRLERTAELLAQGFYQ